MKGEKLALALVAILFAAGCFGSPAPTGRVVPLNHSTNRSTNPIKTGSFLTTPQNETATLNDSARTLAREAANITGAARYVGALAIEPTIGIAKSGAIFFLADVNVLRSTDDGVSWKDVTPRLGPVANPPNTNDPYLYVDPATSRVFVDQNQGAACTLLVTSDDGGQTWANEGAPCGPEGANDHQTLVAAKPRALSTIGYPDIVYYCANGGVTTQCTRSLDGGRTWLPSVPVFVLGSSACDTITSHLEASPDGTVYLPVGMCGVPEVAVTQDDGQSWSVHTIPTKVPIEDHELRVAADSENNLYAFWQGTDGMPYLAYSRDHAATWSTPVMVGFSGLTGMDFPALSAGAPGRVAFAYVGTMSPHPYNNSAPQSLAPQLGQPATVPGLAWYPYIGETTDAFDPHPTVVTVVAGNPTDPIARGQCGRTRCDGITDFIEMQTAPDGRPWAAFADACTKSCATDPNGTDTYTGTGGAPAPGFAGTISNGPSLEGGMLSPLPPAPSAVSGSDADSNPPASSATTDHALGYSDALADAPRSG